MSHQSDPLYRELMELRRGRGIERRDLGAGLGPEIRELSRVSPSDPDWRIKPKVQAALAALIRELPRDLRRAAELAYALDRDHLHPLLQDRVGLLAEELKIQPRTARRRMDDAADLIVQAARAARQSVGDVEPTRSGSGWEIRSLEALMRLDTDTPQLYETRTIAATRDLTELTLLFSLPRPPADPAAVQLDVDALYGVRLGKVRQPAGGDHYEVPMTLPTTLRAGEKHQFCLHYSVPAGREISPYYAIVPLSPCDQGLVRIRFHPDRPPAAVWLLEDVPYLQLSDKTPGPRPLVPDAVGDVFVRFGALREGHGYGVAWAP